MLPYIAYMDPMGIYIIHIVYIYIYYNNNINITIYIHVCILDSQIPRWSFNSDLYLIDGIIYI